ncbi:MAG: ribose-phosphate pyrophosphokinase [Betaproteobacteria bacterium]|nr:MAG: ribose-phosphate pyrophosphokinase [Betaproteobacteria bacterium]
MSSIALVAGDAHPELAREIARSLETALVPVSVSAFADGETRVSIETDIRDADLYIVQPTSAPTNERLMTLALIADAARAAGAARVTAVVPYFGYARQDVRKRAGEPRSAQLAARILHCAGVERMVALELHSPALESAFEMPLIHLDADELMLRAIRGWNIADLAIVAPDAGGLKRAQRYATALAAPLAVIAKTRPGADFAVALRTLGEVRGRPCLVVDDMASTGGTIAGAARALHDAGAKEVHALFIHAVMAPGALDRICAASVRRIATTDSVRSDPDPRIRVVPIAPLLAQTLDRLAGRSTVRMEVTDVQKS